ncbi:MAG: hypothetical protein VW707_07140, partial [Candidatus Puniceispirillum sp.]
MILPEVLGGGHRFVRRALAFHRLYNAAPLWCRPLEGRLYMLLACVAVMVAALANYTVRDQQYRVWQSFPEITEMDDMPLF